MVYIVAKSRVYTEWFHGLRDQVAKGRITARIDRFAKGNPGDVRPVGQGVSEMRIDHGPGYRVYYKQTGDVIFLLLCGGDKSTQDRDIKTALRMAQELPR